MIKKSKTIFISFMIIMVVLGASDSLRGVFALTFQEHFHLSAFQVALIITVSYIGNLVFLFFGGSYIDRKSKKSAFITILSLWLFGAVLFVCSDNFILLLIGMFFCMGASTLMNTMINILVPAIFTASPGFIVNLLFFIQGIGTSGSQNVIGRFSMNFSSWKIVNSILILLAVIGLVVFLNADMPNLSQSNKKNPSFLRVIKKPAFWFFVFIFGFYFIAEHGILNWFFLYGTEELELSASNAALYLSLFFGGITVGRLLLAPIVHKFGAARSIAILGSFGMALYIFGILLGSHALFLLSFSGFSISIVYPTLVLLVQSYFEKDRISTAIGSIISLATVFDIGFSVVFGKLVDYISLKEAFYILPASMFLFCITYIIFCLTVKPIENEVQVRN